ncbi:MAG TPA: hypothetical protein VFF73_28120 [Planctomycetota bacterium]|nr:hypothetical protein [Planctomycetota bacterium]
MEETVEAVAARSVLEGSFHMGLCFDALPGASRTRVTPLDAARSITTAVAAWALR